jgi:hypothetical protein
VAVVQEQAMSDEYEIRLKGHLGTQWSQWFNGLVIHHERDETVLTGHVADQAALHGILARIRDIGIALLALKLLHDSHANADLTPGERTARKGSVHSKRSGEHWQKNGRLHSQSSRRRRNWRRTARNALTRSRPGHHSRVAAQMEGAPEGTRRHFPAKVTCGNYEAKNGQAKNSF